MTQYARKRPGKGADELCSISIRTSLITVGLSPSAAPKSRQMADKNMFFEVPVKSKKMTVLWGLRPSQGGQNDDKCK